MLAAEEGGFAPEWMRVGPEDTTGLVAILLATLAIIFWAAQHPVLGRIFKVIPVLVFCYFVPTALATAGVIPHSAPLYDWIKSVLLPVALLLLILSLDLPGIIRLGPKAGIMLLAGTFGVVLGAPIALFIMQGWLPDDIWRGLSALSGSWIGGSGNMIAVGNMAEANDAQIAMMVVPDVFVASIWMAVLLYFAGRHEKIDAWTGADASAIRELEDRMASYEAQVARVPKLPDYIIVLAVGFVGCWLAKLAGSKLPEIGGESPIISHSTWVYILITSAGVILSFTPARRLEGAGASKVGSVMIYLLVASIGAHANFVNILEAPALVITAMIWMSIHVGVLLFVGWMIRAPIFFVAVGSQANIGGAASAPVVAAAFHPSLTAVGVLLAVAGYVLGTYAGGLCMFLLRWASGNL